MAPDAHPWITGNASSTVAIDDCNGDFDNCWEATIVALPNGTLVASDGQREAISRSFDGGKTWSRVRGPWWPVEQMAEVPGWQDADSLVTATPDGKLVFSSIASVYEDGPMFLAGAATLIGIHVAVSPDAGTTWTSNVILGVGDTRTTAVADRQWVAGGPHGELYLSFNHFNGAPYYFAYAGVAAVVGPWLGNVVQVTRSDDGGATWSDFRDVAPELTSCQYEGPPVVAGDGTLLLPMTRYQPATCARDPTGSVPTETTSAEFLVAKSLDGGLTFTTERVASMQAGADLPVLFPVIGLGSDGTLAAAWARTDGRVAVSVRGEDGHWPAPVVWTAPGGNVSAPPGLVVGPAGRVTISYVTNRGPVDMTGRATLSMAWGDATGPAGDMVLWGPTLQLGRANGDYANLVAVPRGKLASAMAVWDFQQKAFHVMAVVASP